MHQDSQNPWTFSFVNDSWYTVIEFHEVLAQASLAYYSYYHVAML